MIYKTRSSLNEKTLKKGLRKQHISRWTQSYTATLLMLGITAKKLLGHD